MRPSQAAKDGGRRSASGAGRGAEAKCTGALWKTRPRRSASMRDATVREEPLQRASLDAVGPHHHLNERIGQHIVNRLSGLKRHDTPFRRSPREGRVAGPLTRRPHSVTDR